jgi:YkoY family integral membrane protein
VEILKPITDFITSQSIGWPDLAVILLLTLLEGALSIDNALVLGLLAKRLRKDQQASALNIGMSLAFIFRFVAIFAAALILRWTIVKFLGGAYLVYIAVRHLFFETKQLEEGKIELDEHGNPVLLEPTGQELTESKTESEIRGRVPVYVKPETMDRVGFARFWPTVGSIGLTDIAFAVDSILAAIALIGSPPAATKYHPKLWVVFVGALLGMVALRFAAGLVIKLLEKFPRFEMAAYLLVLVIGTKLLADWGFNSDWSFNNQPLMAKMVGGAKKSFEELEKSRTNCAKNYDKWLEANWIFKIKPHEEPAVEAPKEDAPQGEAPKKEAPPFVPPPHLLDFHDLRRPEAISFWVCMLLALLSGFIPPRKKKNSAAGQP